MFTVDGDPSLLGYECVFVKYEVSAFFGIFGEATPHECFLHTAPCFPHFLSVWGDDCEVICESLQEVINPSYFETEVGTALHVSDDHHEEYCE